MQSVEADGPGVAITREEGEDGPLTSRLRELGVRVHHCGSIDFAPPEDPAPFLGAMESLGEYDWICFSSPRAVKPVVQRVASPPPGLKVAVVGPSTADAVGEGGWPVHRVPEEGSGEGLVEAFRQAGDAGGKRVFFPASAVARGVIPEGLRALGAQVDQVTAYRLVNLPLDPEGCRAALDAGEVQAITFASPSAMEGLKKALGLELFQRLSRDVSGAAMGPTTAAALEGVGWGRIHVAREPTAEALADAALEAADGGPESR